jgi:hypothetical protein
VPSDPNRQYTNEVDLVTGGLGYTEEIWEDADWQLYAVHDPVSIVSAPAHVVSADETSIVFDIATPGTVTLHIRPSKYLQLATMGSSPIQACLSHQDQNSVQAVITVPGRYQLEGSFSVPKMFGDQSC